ncbi:hypothetical protein D3C87_1337890 [compost metagenome]
MQKILATSLIILGVVLLNLNSNHAQKEEQVAKVEEKEVKPPRAPAEVRVGVETPRNAG